MDFLRCLSKMYLTKIFQSIALVFVCKKYLTPIKDKKDKQHSILIIILLETISSVTRNLKIVILLPISVKYFKNN